MEYPGNSYKQRGIMVKIPETIFHTEGRHYVRIEYTVWPEIYGDQFPIHFPTVHAATTFARNNCTPTTPNIRVYTPEGTLIKTFNYATLLTFGDF